MKRGMKPPIKLKAIDTKNCTRRAAVAIFILLRALGASLRSNRPHLFEEIASG
jgi:hypothetical protein